MVEKPRSWTPSEDLQCKSARCPGRNFVTLKIQTDDGVYELGDATLNGREMAVVSYLADHVIPCLLGRDPFQIEDIWQYVYRGAYWRRGPVTMTAFRVSCSPQCGLDFEGYSRSMKFFRMLRAHVGCGKGSTINTIPC